MNDPPSWKAILMYSNTKKKCFRTSSAAISNSLGITVSNGSTGVYLSCLYACKYPFCSDMIHPPFVLYFELVSKVNICLISPQKPLDASWIETEFRHHGLSH